MTKYEKIISHLKKFWRLYAVLIAVILLASAVLWSLTTISDYLDNRKGNQHNSNIGNVANEAINQQVIVNQQTENYNNAIENTEKDRTNTNLSLSNIYAVNNANYSNSNQQRARDAQCRFNPERCR